MSIFFQSAHRESVLENHKLELRGECRDDYIYSDLAVWYVLKFQGIKKYWWKNIDCFSASMEQIQVGETNFYLFF